MSPAEFVAFWRAEPFRPFRVRANNDTCDVHDAQQVIASPDLALVVIIADGSRMLTLPPAEIVSCEPIDGPSPAAVEIPDYLLQAAHAVAGVVDSSPVAEPTPPSADDRPPMDPGRVEFFVSTNPEGVHVVQADVTDAAGRALFTTAGTQWNVHGVEPFENGTSLYLHHLAHPCDEQRVILWPGHGGTFESFSEKQSFDQLFAELKRRDARLARKPARPKEPTAAWFRAIALEFPVREVDGKSSAFGPDPTAEERYRLEFVPTEAAPGTTLQNPRIVDVHTDEVIIDFVGSPWHVDMSRYDAGDPWRIVLRHWPDRDHAVTLHFDMLRYTVTIDDHPVALPVFFVERHLYNYVLYEPWDAMLAALLAGPHDATVPDLTLPLAGGFKAELWPGEKRIALPFLQPRFLDSEGRTVLDFRATAWAARLHADPSRPRVHLLFVSNERQNRFEAAPHLVQVDFVTHHVTCSGMEGWTSLGMLQTFLRHVASAKWMNEALPELLGKARSIPGPESDR